MKYGKALAVAAATVVCIYAGGLVFGFILQSDATLPGMGSVTSTDPQGKPRTELQFNPVVPLALLIGLSVAIWAIGKLWHRNDRNVRR